MNDTELTPGRLNDYIYSFIQSDGIDYVTNNYIELRNSYYNINHPT